MRQLSFLNYFTLLKISFKRLISFSVWPNCIFQSSSRNFFFILRPLNHVWYAIASATGSRLVCCTTSHITHRAGLPDFCSWFLLADAAPAFCGVNTEKKLSFKNTKMENRNSKLHFFCFLPWCDCAAQLTKYEKQFEQSVQAKSIKWHERPSVGMYNKMNRASHMYDEIFWLRNRINKQRLHSKAFCIFPETFANFIWFINMHSVWTKFNSWNRTIYFLLFSATILIVLESLHFVWFRKRINPAWQRHEFIGWNTNSSLCCFTNCTLFKTTCDFQMHFWLFARFFRTSRWIEKKMIFFFWTNSAENLISPSLLLSPIIVCGLVKAKHIGCAERAATKVAVLHSFYWSRELSHRLLSTILNKLYSFAMFCNNKYWNEFNRYLHFFSCLCTWSSMSLSHFQQWL